MQYRLKCKSIPQAGTLFTLIAFTACLSLSACSKAQIESHFASNNKDSSKTTEKNEPYVEGTYEAIVPTESDIDIEQKQMVAKARKLLHEKNYAELDKYIDSLVTSREACPNGRWKLDLLYMEFTDPERAGKKATEAEWLKLIDEFKAWSAASKSSSNALIALAEAYTGYAWLARGNGYANTVSDEGWRLMGERIDTAKNYLKQADVLNSKNPRKWSAALIAGLGSNIDKRAYEEIVSEAQKKEPTYELVLFERSNFLRPRWSGEEGEWEKSIADTADKLGGENGDKMYARLLWAAHAMGECKHLYQTPSIDWERAKRGFILLEKENPKSLAVTSRFCVLSVSAGDRPQARELFDKLKGRMTESAWTTRKYFSKSRDWAYAMKP